MKKFLVLASLLLLPTSAAWAAEEVDNTSHLPLPRFAALRNDEVNMRAGPGFRYPIEWIFKRRGLPVEITAEYDIWRKVRDPQGTEGWVSKTELTGKRSVIVTGDNHDLFRSRRNDNIVVAHLKDGAIGQILFCAKDRCKVRFGEIKGYLPKSAFWGAYPNETFD